MTKVIDFLDLTDQQIEFGSSLDPKTLEIICDFKVGDKSTLIKITAKQKEQMIASFLGISSAEIEARRTLLRSAEEENFFKSKHHKDSR